MLDGKQIMAVVVSLIVLVVGILAVGVIVSEQSDVLPDTESSVSTTTYEETFEDDTNDTDPTSTWYTYTEEGWTWANVSNETAKAHTGDNTYRINDTDGDQDWTNFNFISDNYNYTKFWVQVNNHTHNETNITIKKSNGVYLARINLTGGNISFHNLTTEGWKHNISNMTWYGVRFDFNYTDDTIRGRLYDRLGNVLNDTWLEMYDGSEDFQEIAHFNISGMPVQPAHMWLDNWEVYDRDYTAAETETPDILATTDTVATLLGILIIVAAIMSIAVLMYPYIRQ